MQLKKRILEYKRAERDGMRPRKVPVVWKDDMIFRKRLEGVTERVHHKRDRRTPAHLVLGGIKQQK